VPLLDMPNDVFNRFALICRERSSVGTDLALCPFSFNQQFPHALIFRVEVVKIKIRFKELFCLTHQKGGKKR
jgi:hypothetical protein